MKVELAKPLFEIPKGTQAIPMQLYLEDGKKRDLHKGDEAIAFEFVAGNDVPEEIAKEMVCIFPGFKCCNYQCFPICVVL